MNERYLFRGKRVDNGEWIIGQYSILPFTEKSGIYPTEKDQLYSCPAIETAWREVDPATVGQCTGLCDKKQTLIFEGDVVSWWDSDDNLRTDVVKWMLGGLCLCNAHYTVGSYINCNIEVIDNIHDHPQTWRNCTTCKHGDITPCKLNRIACGNDYKYWE